jgi:hypothetical protein
MPHRIFTILLWPDRALYSDSVGTFFYDGPPIRLVLINQTRLLCSD